MWWTRARAPRRRGTARGTTAAAAPTRGACRPARGGAAASARQGCHDSIVVADGDHVEGDLHVRSQSAGIAAVQQIALTKWDQATLLKRVWGFDALTCTGCGERMRFIAVIKDRAVIERILKHIGEDAEEERRVCRDRLGRIIFGDRTGRAGSLRAGRVA